MTQEEKMAKELISNMMEAIWTTTSNPEQLLEVSRECALVAVGAVLKTVFTNKSSYDLWKSVEEIIKKK